MSTLTINALQELLAELKADLDHTRTRADWVRLATRIVELERIIAAAPAAA